MPAYRRHTLKAALLASLLAIVGLGGGCSDKLDTGYEPRRLGVSGAERRAYYAAPFTPEAAAGGASNREQELNNVRRPGNAAYR